MDSSLNDLQNEAIAAATEHIRGQRKKYGCIKVVAVCLTVLLAVGIVCATVLACFTIREQQYAMNMQFASLMEFVSGAEVVTEEADAGDGGVAVAGSGNTVAGGDVNG